MLVEEVLLEEDVPLVVLSVKVQLVRSAKSRGDVIETSSLTVFAAEVLSREVRIVFLRIYVWCVSGWSTGHIEALRLVQTVLDVEQQCLILGLVQF